ncbi:hypothetical protein Bbelb_340240 [Branchiostoma belcheri]|nr:hypothetical protein Bbelb_340240 [Branchiostoma belcheri]
MPPSTLPWYRCDQFGLSGASCRPVSSAGLMEASQAPRGPRYHFTCRNSRISLASTRLRKAAGSSLDQASGGGWKERLERVEISGKEGLVEARIRTPEGLVEARIRTPVGKPGGGYCPYPRRKAWWRLGSEGLVEARIRTPEGLVEATESLRQKRVVLSAEGVRLIREKGSEDQDRVFSSADRGPVLRVAAKDQDSSLNTCPVEAKARCYCEDMSHRYPYMRGGDSGQAAGFGRKDYEIVSPECGELRILRYNSGRHDSTSMIFGRQITAVEAEVKYKFWLPVHLTTDRPTLLLPAFPPPGAWSRLSSRRAARRERREHRLVPATRQTDARYFTRKLTSRSGMCLSAACQQVTSVRQVQYLRGVNTPQVWPSLLTPRLTCRVLSHLFTCITFITTQPNPTALPPLFGRLYQASGGGCTKRRALASTRLREAAANKRRALASNRLREAMATNIGYSLYQASGGGCNKRLGVASTRLREAAVTNAGR